MCTPHVGPAVDYESISIFTLVEEDGELKVSEYKDFADFQKRGNFYKAVSQEKQIA